MRLTSSARRVIFCGQTQIGLSQGSRFHGIPLAKFAEPSSLGIEILAQQIPDPERLREIFSRLGFVTTCQGMTPVLQCAFKAAQVSDTTVLLQGETGTGKQVIARAIHALDQKR